MQVINFIINSSINNTQDNSQYICGHRSSFFEISYQSANKRQKLHVISTSLHLVKRTSRAVNFLNVSEMKTYWINLVVISLLIAKVFLKHNINIFVHIFFIQLFLSLFTLYWSEKRFSHLSKIRLCTTKEFFLIELIKIWDDLNTENQYLCLQLNCLNQIKCHKKITSFSNWN